MKNTIARRGTAYRLGVLSRVLAASLGGYAVTALVSSSLAWALLRWGWSTRAEAVLWASLSSFALYTGIAIGVFTARSASRAWAYLCVVSISCGGLLLVLME